MNYYASFFMCAVVIAGIHSGAAIHCYVCNSGGKYEGSECEHIPVDGVGVEHLVKDCGNLTSRFGQLGRNYTLCRKFVQDVDGDHRVVRSCATDGRVGQCVDRTGTAKIKLRYCECQNESPEKPCNGAVVSAPTSVFIDTLVLCIAAIGFAAVCV